jgi:hypothetical protein
MVSATDPYGRIIVFLFSFFYFNYLLNYTHETEYTPFETHYFSKNVVRAGMEPGPLDQQPRTLTTRPQRRSHSEWA